MTYENKLKTAYEEQIHEFKQYPNLQNLHERLTIK